MLTIWVKLLWFVYARKPKGTVMLKLKIFKDAKGEFRWSALDGNNKVIADCAEGYSTERSLILGLKNVLGEFRGEVRLIGFGEPLGSKRGPVL